MLIAATKTIKFYPNKLKKRRNEEVSQKQNYNISKWVYPTIRN